MSPDNVQTAFPLLSLLVWLPILGGASCLLLGNARANTARWLGLAFAVATLALSVPLLTGFDHANAGEMFSPTQFGFDLLLPAFFVGIRAPSLKSGDESVNTAWARAE